jgi:thiol-disulfide isomerase/thioredoxin
MMLTERRLINVMAKTKQVKTSSPPQQRSRREARQEAKNQATRKRRKRATPQRSPWLFIGGILVVVAVVVGLFLFLGHQSTTGTTSTSSNQDSTPLDAATLKQITNVNSDLLAQTGTGGVSNPFKAAQGNLPLLKGPTGKPEVFFYGAEWCPLCAAERWSVAVAMSRFGTFHSLRETTSASDDSYPDTSTLSFYQSNYTSSYIDFLPVETQDRQRNTLQNPGPQEQQVLTRNNVQGFPFMDIGDRYLITSASYDPGVLRTNAQDPSSQPLSQQEIANQLAAGGNSVSQNILGTANYLTAAICTITNNQPSQVCSTSSIKSIQATISQSSTASWGGLSGDMVADTSPTRRLA